MEFLLCFLIALLETHPLVPGGDGVISGVSFLMFLNCPAGDTYCCPLAAVAAVVLGMWCAAGRHANAGVGIGMPALVLVKNEN